jgi:MraZ protein
MSAQWWKRIFLGNAMDVEMDSTGRILVSPELRAAAGITRDTMLLGMGNHFELWDKPTYDGSGGELSPDRQPGARVQFPFRRPAGHAHGHHAGRERGSVAGNG